jgi:hypothetical protein
MGYVRKIDTMSNNYSRYHTWKWIKKLFFNFLKISVLSAFLPQKYFGRKLCHKQYTMEMVHELVQNVDTVIITAQRGRLSLSVTQLSCLEAWNFSHWPVKGTKSSCHLQPKENEVNKHILLPGVWHCTVFFHVLRIITWKQALYKYGTIMCDEPLGTYKGTRSIVTLRLSHNFAVRQWILP